MIWTSRWSRWASVVSIVVGLLPLSQCQDYPHTQPTNAGLIGDVGPVARSCQGVAVTPNDNVQRVIDSNPAGTTLCLSAGTYRLDTPLVPKRGDVLVGHQGTVLNGSKILTGWWTDGRVWSTIGFLPPAPGGNGQCNVSVATCTYAEDVFFDKQRLQRASSTSTVTAGTVYADYSTNTITIADDPRSHLIEQAVAPSLIRATVDDVTVANLVIEQAANPAQVGAIENRQVTPYKAGTGWRILNNEVRLNHGAGVGFADASTVTGNFIHHQGQLGFSAWGARSVISNNEISFNNTAGYSAEWEAGGSKSWTTERQTLTHNYVHDNAGPGLWADGGNINTTYEYNKIDDNWCAGIQHEISYDAVIRHNEISGNGRRHKGWAWDAGIQIQSSGGTRLIDIAYNVVTGNANGITVLDSGGRAMEQPAPHGPHIVQNVWIHENTITMLAGEATGAVEDTGNAGIFTTNHNRFDANTYYLDSLTDPHFFWAYAKIDWIHWRGSGNGNDLNGSAQLVSR